MTERFDVAVRVAERDDLQPVLDIHAEQGSRAEGRASPVERRTWQRMMATPGLRVYIAEVEHLAAGTATVMTMPNVTYDCAPTLFIEAVVVSPCYRRQRVVTAILQTILDDARADGCHKVQLLSHKRHATDGAHRLYTSIGFEAEAEGFRLYLSEDR